MRQLPAEGFRTHWESGGQGAHGLTQLGIGCGWVSECVGAHEHAQAVQGLSQGPSSCLRLQGLGSLQQLLASRLTFLADVLTVHGALQAL